VVLAIGVVAVLVPLMSLQSAASATTGGTGVRKSSKPAVQPAGQSAVAASSNASKGAKSAKPMFTPTGYFNTAEKHGRWFLVTPQGDPFYASGIDSVATDGSGTDQVTGQCPYCETVAADFPSTAAWATATIAQLRSWGFNSLGSFSDNTDLGPQMPYEVQLSMASGDDWFAPSFVTNADNVAATQVAPLANDPNVIGYFTDTELDWGPLLGSGANTYNTVLAQYLALPAGSPGLAVAQQYVGNPSGFLYALATRYFSVTTAAIRTYDTHHLILGVKAEGQEIEPSLLEAAKPYVNVFSIEDYDLWPGFDQGADDFWPAYLPVAPNLADFEADFNGPFMIGEYSFIAYGPETPNTLPGIYLSAPNQQARAVDYENYLAPLYEDAPWLVGDDWFQYVDEPVNGRTGDGEDDNFGMIDVNGNPYPTMVSAVSMMHAVVADEDLDSGPICDSWTNTGSGVSCDAYMPAQSTFPLNIVTTSLPTGKVGTSYFFGGAYAAGGTPPYKYKVIQGTLPKGLKFNTKSGLITGTPKFSGTSTFTIQAGDSAGDTPVTQTLSITVNPDVALSVTPAGLKTARLNKAYSGTLKATGGTLPYTWTVTSGALPPGLTLNSNGSITGEATATGTFDFSVQVTDSSTTVETATANLGIFADT
jgi:hypothetical protein